MLTCWIDGRTVRQTPYVGFTLTALEAASIITLDAVPLTRHFNISGRRNTAILKIMTATLRVQLGIDYKYVSWSIGSVIVIQYSPWWCFGL